MCGVPRMTFQSFGVGFRGHICFCCNGMHLFFFRNLSPPPLVCSCSCKPGALSVVYLPPFCQNMATFLKHINDVDVYESYYSNIQRLWSNLSHPDILSNKKVVSGFLIWSDWNREKLRFEFRNAIPEKNKHLARFDLENSALVVDAFLLGVGASYGSPGRSRCHRSYSQR